MNTCREDCSLKRKWAIVGYAMSLNLLAKVSSKQLDFSGALDYSLQALKRFEKYRLQ